MATWALAEAKAKLSELVSRAEHAEPQEITRNGNSKPKRDPRVDRWLENVDDRDLHISIVTIAELWYGIQLLPVGKKRADLERWVEEDVDWQFFNRVEFFNLEAARLYGRVLANAKKQGFAADPLDAMIAAIALAGGMFVVTLNRKHFEPLGVQIADI